MENTVTGQDVGKLDRRLAGSGSSSTLIPVTAFSLLFAVAANHAIANARASTPVIKATGGQQEASLSSSVVKTDATTALALALMRFHDRLLASQRDLPPEELKILIEHLWDMYE